MKLRIAPACRRHPADTVHSRSEYRLKPRLFGKFFLRGHRRRDVGTLFIKIQCILSEQYRSMVNRPCPPPRT
jgi:hypothetical protein